MSTVGKLVVLKLDGDFEQHGFPVSLEIGGEQARPSIEMPGELPPNPELVMVLNEWRETYRSLEVLSRISPQKIIYGGSVNRQKECQRLADKLRDRLNGWLESRSFQAINRRLRAALSPDEPIRVLIRTQNHDLHHLPWHFWDFVEQYPQAEIALSACWSAPIKPLQKTVSGGKVRILAILGNSEGIDVKSDRRLLKNLPNADVTFLSEPKREDISDRLWDQPWDILFFAGHSQTENKRGQIYINSQKESLTIAQLKYGLEQAIAKGLQLAIFNSCDGLGLAYDLEQLHLPQLIVMREPVPDQVAQKFAKYFLTAFAAGDSLYLAERKARQRLHGLENDFPCASWLPVICQNPAEVPPTWGDLQGEIELAPVQLSLQPPATSRKTLQLRMVFLVSLAMTSLVMWGRWQGHLQPWELKAYDHMMQLQSPLSTDRRLLVVRITQDDIDRLQQPPEETGRGAQTLSDHNLEKLLNILKSYKPLAIGLDLFRGGKVDGKLYPKLKASFRSGGVVAGCFGRTPQYAKTVAAPDDIPDNSIGFLLAPFEHDDVIRRYSLWQTIDDPSYPCRAKQLGSFGFNLALRYLQTKGITRQDEPDDPFIKVGNAVFEELKLHRGGYHKPDSEVSGGMQFILNYRPYRDYTTDISPTVTLTDVLNNHLNSKDVSGRIVLIGVDISEDRYKTPYTHDETQPSEMLPGVLYHAQAISYLIDVVQDKRSMIWTLPWWLDSLWVLTWAMIGGIIVRYAGWGKRFIKQLLLKLILPSSITLGTLYGLCLIVFFWSGGWLPLVPSILAFSMTSGAIVTYRLLQLQRNS